MLCAMDVSGDQKSKNHKYLAVVMCTHEALNSIVKKAGLNRFRKSWAYKHNIRNSVIPHLNKENAGCLVLCVKIEKNATIDKIMERGFMRRSGRTVSNKAMNKLYHKAVIRSVEERLEKFLLAHKQEISGIKVEVDEDCRDIVTESSMSHTEKSYTHMIADATAWSNNRGGKLKGVKEVDITESLTEYLTKKIRAKYMKDRKRRHKRHSA